jgi:hypothetical protein
MLNSALEVANGQIIVLGPCLQNIARLQILILPNIFVHKEHIFPWAQHAVPLQIANFSL